jgi:hypothetical protein
MNLVGEVESTSCHLVDFIRFVELGMITQLKIHSLIEVENISNGGIPYPKVSFVIK